MKVGDILLCKKTFYYMPDKLEKGKYYKIVSINDIYNKKYYRVYLILTSISIGFNPIINITFNNDESIWIYFYNPQEMRKLKLKNINESIL